MKQSGYTSLLLACLLVSICLLPILRSGLYSDDLPNLETRANIKHIPSFDFAGRTGLAIESWKKMGRYNPLALSLQLFVFDQFKTVFAYKCYVFFCNLLAVASFAFLLYALGLSVQFITLAIFFYMAEIQFRIQFHDAFTSLQGLYPLFSVTIFLSLAFISLYLRDRGKYFYYVLSLIFTIMALLFSEVGIILIPMFFALALFASNDFRKRLLLVAPLIFAGFVYIGYVMYLRGLYGAKYDGIQTNFNSEKMLHVLNIQLFSALPFSNLYKQKAIPELLFAQATIHGNLISVILIIVLGLYLLFADVKDRQKVTINKNLLLFIFAVLLFVVPAIVLMPSVKYQSEMWLGAGYLPVYIQNFGTALFFALIANYCISGGKMLARGIFMVLGCANIVGAVFALLFNSALIDVMNYNRSLPADAMYRAIRRGILSSVPTGSNIVLASDFFWHDQGDYKTIIENETGKRFNVSDLEAFPFADRAMVNNPCVLLDCKKGDTIYTRLYQMNCATGAKERLLMTDTVLQSTRISELENTILAPRY